MSKETSIEYLVKKVMCWEKDHEYWIEMPTREFLEYAKQAFEMHKKECEESYIEGAAGGITNTFEGYYENAYKDFIKKYK